MFLGNCFFPAGMGGAQSARQYRRINGQKRMRLNFVEKVTIRQVNSVASVPEASCWYLASLPSQLRDTLQSEQAEYQVDLKKFAKSRRVLHKFITQLLSWRACLSWDTWPRAVVKVRRSG